MDNKEMPLTDVAHRLSWPWARAWRALLTGRLEGQKRGGRWFVSTASVERVERMEREEAAITAGG